MTSMRNGGLVSGFLALLVGAACLPACTSATEVDPGPSCTNGARDEGENGIDCGGVCPVQCTGSGCTANEECASGKCEGAVCAAPAGKVCGVGAPVATCEDGQGCELDKDCNSGFCDAAKCATPPAESHSDGKINGGETGVDCGGSVKATAPCPDGEKCIDSADCVGTCNAGVCGPAGPTDGKKNNGETDIDCGGPNAPKCADGKDCAANADCADDYCPDATKKCTAPRYDDGVKNGTETDVDCGGTGAGMKKCAEGLLCGIDADCNGACKDFAGTKKCIDAPSCKPHFGGDTCGTNEVGSGVESHLGPAAAVQAGHESCCRTLPVAGYTDPNQPGKTVYVDKYEITAGRMRAFLEAVGGGVDGAGNAKDANVRAWMAAHRPTRWNNGWEDALPTSNANTSTTYTIKNTTTNLLYPGHDQYLINNKTQTTWWIGNAAGAFGAGTSVDFTIFNGVFYALGANHFFPEYWAQQPTWSQGPDYAASHALNCTNTDGSYGYSTYWFDKTTVTTYSGGTHGKYFSKTDLDQKALNCTPNALFAAFCAWDGGQLVTGEVLDNITGNTVSPVFDAGGVQTGKLAVGRSTCGGPNGPGSVITYSDGGSVPCSGVYYYPNDNGNDYYDGSSRIAPPGRVLGDLISKSAGDEPWMDLVGNLQEVVLKKGETIRFDYRGYGTEWGSITHHRNQQTTPRNKGGAFGARCMRFK
jgi:hypothetical protein